MFVNKILLEGSHACASTNVYAALLLPVQSWGRGTGEDPRVPPGTQADVGSRRGGAEPTICTVTSFSCPLCISVAAMAPLLGSNHCSLLNTLKDPRDEAASLPKHPKTPPVSGEALPGDRADPHFEGPHSGKRSPMNHNQRREESVCIHDRLLSNKSPLKRAA